jgi:methionyl-tRNA synthetase
VFFLTGTDEHAAKVADSAAERGMSAQELADANAEVFEQTFARLGMSNDDFIRTSQARHTEKVIGYVQQLLDRGDVYPGEYEGWYDPGQEEYLPENKAREYDYKSPFNGRALIRKKERNYFFALSRYQGRLQRLLRERPEFVQPEARRNEVAARIEEGLNDVPISRTGTGGWGITMPNDPEQTIYVWIDALFNYLTSVDTEEREHYWPADIHLIAKDILWFHAVIWPAMLMALNRRLPRQVYSHSFWIAEGQKMSKSLGNFIDLEKIDHYAERFSIDALRWFLATQGPLGSTDSDFAHAKFVEVYNADLANTLGNCASRVTNMVARYFDGQLPAPNEELVEAEGSHLRRKAEGMFEEVDSMYQKVAVGAANAAALDVIRAVDTYIEQTQPFRLAKESDQRENLGTILYYCAEALRIGSLGLWAVVPEKVERIWGMLGVDYNTGQGELRRWCEWGQLVPGMQITKGKPLFPRVQE